MWNVNFDADVDVQLVVMDNHNFNDFYIINQIINTINCAISYAKLR